MIDMEVFSMQFPALRASGMTLVELVVTVAILAILMAVSVPSLAALMNTNRVASETNTLFANLLETRSQAVTRDSWVVLCPSADGSHCSGDHTGWGKGYIRFEDVNRNRQRDTEEAVIGVERPEGEIRIESSSGLRSSVTFYPTGRAWGSNTTLRICGDGDPERNRAIVISVTGRPRVSDRLVEGGEVRCGGA
jgi:type IV fimbrial biogenesis protein FimT